MKWHVDSVHVGIFIPPGATQDDALRVWARIFGNDTPDSFQKATTANPSLLSQAAGERDGVQVGVAAQVGRIDVLVSASEGVVLASRPEDPPRLKDLDVTKVLIEKYTHKVLSHIEPIRLAIILDLAITIPIDSEVSAFKNALPEIPVAPGASELSFKMNVRKPLVCNSELRMNRICSWTTGVVGYVPNIPNRLFTGNVLPRPYLGLNIDCNTAPEDRIGHGLGLRAFSELSSQAYTIAVNGYSELLNG